jgi:hypothetical protein
MMNTISRKQNETKKQFEFRKKIYDEVYDDTKDAETALIYSNIWVNVLSLGCAYPKEVMMRVEKYKPKENIFI